MTDKGGNVGESRAQLLGGHFSLMMLVEIAEKEVKTLEEQLGSGVAGMKTECLEADDQKNATVAPTIACECAVYYIILLLMMFLFNFY